MNSEVSCRWHASTLEFGRSAWEAGQRVIESHHEERDRAPFAAYFIRWLMAGGSLSLQSAQRCHCVEFWDEPEAYNRLPGKLRVPTTVDHHKRVG